MTRNFSDTLRLSLVALFMGAFGAVVATGLTSLVSAHGGDETLVHGCVREVAVPNGTLGSLFGVLLHDGNVRIVDADETCKNGEVAIDWPAAGDGGLTGYEIVPAVSPFTTFATTGDTTQGAECPVGKRVLGGGFSSPSLTATVSYPSDDRHWVIVVENQTGALVMGTLTVYAICAEATP